MLKRLLLPVMAAFAVMTSGCALIYQPVGLVLESYSNDEALPYLLSSGDFDLTACGSGQGLNQLIGSFGEVWGLSRPAKLMVGTNTLAGLCAETEAQEAKLQFDRALRAGRTEEARDARIRSQRLYRRTALRQYQVYQDVKTAWGDIGGECPSLGGETDRALYLIGVLTSVQGLLSDIQASSSVGVPTDIAAKAGRASQCLDNERWWGVPNALQAVVWLSVPGSAPDDVDPWTQLKAATDLGEKQGFPLASFLYIAAAYGQSDIAKQKAGIKQLANIYNKGIGPKDYLVLAEIAYSEALFYSDRIWIQETGHRTPIVSLGTFPGEGDSDGGGSDVNVDDYL